MLLQPTLRALCLEERSDFLSRSARLVSHHALTAVRASVTATHGRKLHGAARSLTATHGATRRVQLTHGVLRACVISAWVCAMQHGAQRSGKLFRLAIKRRSSMNKFSKRNDYF